MALDDRVLFAYATLSSGIDATQTTIAVDDASSFDDPTNGYNAAVFDVSDHPAKDTSAEMVRISAAKSGNTLNVTRAQEGTTGVTHNAAGVTYVIIATIGKNWMDSVADILDNFVKVSASEVKFTELLTCEQDANALAFHVKKTATGSGNAGQTDNSGTGIGHAINQTGNGHAQHLNKTSTGAGHALLINNAGTGNSIRLTQTNASAAAFSLNHAVATGTPQVIDRTIDDGELISFRQASTEEGLISVAGTLVTYGTFAGAHPAQIRPATTIPPIGGLVVARGDMISGQSTLFEEDTVNERGEPLIVVHGVRDTRAHPSWRRVSRPRSEFHNRFSYVEGTTTANDPAVYGFYHGQSAPHTWGKSFGRDNDPQHSVISLGLYKVLVTDLGGDIVPGDFLSSSTTEFYAQKQADDILHSHTAAKSIEAVAWASVPVDGALGFKWKLIAATIHCG